METWASKLTRLAADLDKLGYSSVDNRVSPPSNTTTLAALLIVAPPAARSFLEQLFSACGGLDLPDMNNGYFVDAPEKIHKRLLDKSLLEPRALESDTQACVLCFGSDGGGGRFAFVSGAEDGVFYLPVGEVLGATFQDAQTPIHRIAGDASEFGERLLRDVQAFLNQKAGWKYLGEPLCPPAWDR